MYRLPRSSGFAQQHHSTREPGPSPLDTETEDSHCSPVTHSFIRHDLQKFKNKTQKPTDSAFRSAITHAMNAFRLPENVRPYHLKDVFTLSLDIWNSSPGIPWSEQGYRTKDAICKDNKAIQSIRLFWHKVKTGTRMLPPDTCVSVRSGCDKPTKNIGTVWCYPATITFAECMFAEPLIDKYKQLTDSPFAYGYKAALDGSRKLHDYFNSSHQPTQQYATLYFTEFDKSIPTWLVKIAFHILFLNVDFGAYQYYGVPDTRRLLKMWDYIVDYFVKTPIRMSNGERWKKNSGVASGSYFTQLVKTVINFILINWMTISQTGEFPLHQKYLGEDSIICTRHKLCLDDAVKLFSTVGITLDLKNSAQSSTLTNLSFLGYTLEPTSPKL